jgi:hypothetical protein
VIVVASLSPGSTVGMVWSLGNIGGVPEAVDGGVAGGDGDGDEQQRNGGVKASSVPPPSTATPIQWKRTRRAITIGVWRRRVELR